MSERTLRVVEKELWIRLFRDGTAIACETHEDASNLLPRGLFSIVMRRVCAITEDIVFVPFIKFSHAPLSERHIRVFNTTTKQWE